VVEIDGSIHAKRKSKDADSTKFFSAGNLKILRFTNREVMNKLDYVLQVIRDALA
jgi:leucyl-tRNA synthetase